MSSARRAVSFLTPLGGAIEPSPGALVWFPAVGAGIGALLGLVWWGASRAWPAAVVAVLVVGLDLGLTGMLHLDGLVDSADGLLPHLSREARLAAMREPSVGAFGISVGGVVLLARWAAVFSLTPSSLVHSLLLLVGIWAASRALMAMVMVTIPYARAQGGGGLATAFVGSARRAGTRVTQAMAAGALGLAAAVICLVLWRPVAGVISLAAGLAAAGAVVLLAVRRLGGFTGDILGAAGVVLETVALLVASAKW